MNWRNHWAKLCGTFQHYLGSDERKSACWRALIISPEVPASISPRKMPYTQDSWTCCSCITVGREAWHSTLPRCAYLQIPNSRGKAVSGKTPTKWIQEETIKEIERMLCHTRMPIKEIVYRLNFPNASFFGKYFKAQKGMSPKHYRETYINNSQFLNA